MNQFIRREFIRRPQIIFLIEGLHSWGPPKLEPSDIVSLTRLTCRLELLGDVSSIMQKQNFFIFHRINMKVILPIKLTENNLNRTTLNETGFQFCK